MTPPQIRPVNPIEGGRLPKPRWIPRPNSIRRKLRENKIPGKREKTPYRLHRGPVPQPGRMLGKRDCDVPHPWRRVHAELRVLRSAHRPDGSGQTRRGGGSCGRGFDHEPQTRGNHFGHSGRSAGRRRGVLCKDHWSHPPKIPRVQGRGART